MFSNCSNTYYTIFVILFLMINTFFVLKNRSLAFSIYTVHNFNSVTEPSAETTSLNVSRNK